MGLPGAETNPAELTSARTADHVVTPAIFLDGRMALWALLCVYMDPV